MSSNLCESCEKGKCLRCSNAAKEGDLEGLKRAHENGCPWNEDTSIWAAEYGNLECLKYLHENGCPWDRETCLLAAESGYLECLKYAHENGCPWHEDTLIAATRGATDNFECLKYAHDNGCRWNLEAIRRGDDLEYLKFALLGMQKVIEGYRSRLDLANRKEVCMTAAKDGHLESLKYAHENGYPWDEDTCYEAAKENTLACLKYAHENGCPWDERTFQAAIERKTINVECLKYLVKNDCPSDEKTKIQALKLIKASDIISQLEMSVGELCSL